MNNTALTPESVVVTNNPDVTIVEMPLNPVRIKRRLAAVWKIPEKAIKDITVDADGFPEPYLFMRIDLAVLRSVPGPDKGMIDAKVRVSVIEDTLIVSLSVARLEEQEQYPHPWFK